MDIDLGCRCGEVRGRVANASPGNVNRMICYCTDCQAFVHHLGRADLLDASGGTDIVQVAPARLRILQGNDRVAGLRLTPNGLFRWYASCCNTPLGNTLSPAIPFVGIVAQAFDARRDDVFGKPIGAAFGQYAIGGPPEGVKRLDLRLIARALRLVLGWKLRGLAWPHSYFDRASRKPIHPVTVLAPAAREALRPFCGPHPASLAMTGKQRALAQ